MSFDFIQFWKEINKPQQPKAPGVPEKPTPPVASAPAPQTQTSAPVPQQGSSRQHEMMDYLSKSQDKYYGPGGKYAPNQQQAENQSAPTVAGGGAQSLEMFSHLKRH